MRFAIFAHSLVSCWNHGNAHFLRGIARELLARGHTVRVFEPADGWSRRHMRDVDPMAEARFAAAFPGLSSTTYAPDADVPAMIDADVILVHEWTNPAMVRAIGKTRRTGVLLFHDTHHRAVSAPEDMRRFDLSRYDGVLAFGESLAEVYRGRGIPTFVWHEAADTALFRPPFPEEPRRGAVWIGNWGDDERTEELETFLLAPAMNAGSSLDIHGVRYPDTALSAVARHGARYRGWLPNASVPAVFARYAMTVHVPRRYYATVLPGIPTIRVFEALACGIPLVSAPWSDDEGLFRDGDFLWARDGAEMTRHVRALTHDAGMRTELAARGLETILARHTCAHRVSELETIVEALR